MAADYVPIAAREFLERFFEGTQGAIELRAFTANRDGAARQLFSRDPAALERFISDELKAGRNVYFGCATRTKQPGDKEYKGDKAHCLEIVALWAEIDFKDTPQEQVRSLLEKFPLKPSIIIVSGGGIHLYWLLKEPVSARERRIEPILRGIARALSADRSAAEIARVLRVPATLNFKYDPPRPVVLRIADWNRAYNLDDFEMFQTGDDDDGPSSGEFLGIPVPPEVNLEQALKSKLNLRVRHQCGATWYDYHGLRGFHGQLQPCLLQSSPHHAQIENPRECSFEQRGDRFVHHCFDSDCQASGGEGIESRTRRAVKALGLEVILLGRRSAQQDSGTNPWLRAQGMDAFLSGEDPEVEFLYAPVIAMETVTELFSPRGLGKSLWATFVAVKMAKAGLRVMLIDRDNPRKVVRQRLRAFGADITLPALKVITREDAPALTNTAAWAQFPYADFDAVILDSLDSAAEGVGEQDSTKPSLAFKPLLDLARHENGPGVLVLGNTVRTGKHSRGSGVIEDRGDIVFEIRDATGFHPTGNKPWIEELPAASAGDWAGRSARRRRMSRYRLAFIATKYRPAEEPDPFIVEINLETEPWTVTDVTDQVDQEGAEARAQAAEERATAVRNAIEVLKKEVVRRAQAHEAAILKTAAEELLAKAGFKRKIAREAISSPIFEIVETTGKGRPKAVISAENAKNNDGRNTETSDHRDDFCRPFSNDSGSTAEGASDTASSAYEAKKEGGKVSDGGRNTPSLEAASGAGFEGVDFCRPHLEHTAEMGGLEVAETERNNLLCISAKTTNFLPTTDQKAVNAHVQQKTTENAHVSLGRAAEILGGTLASNGEYPPDWTAKEIEWERRTRPTTLRPPGGKRGSKRGKPRRSDA